MIRSQLPGDGLQGVAPSDADAFGSLLEAAACVPLAVARAVLVAALLAVLCGATAQTTVSAPAAGGASNALSNALANVFQPADAVVDDAGHRFKPGVSGKRIITLAPHLTELVYAAGGADRVVAVTRFSDYPEAARRLPQVGDAFSINLEAVARLKPDLIVAWRSGLQQRQRERLEGLGIAVFDSEIGSMEGIASTVQRLGRLMGTDTTANASAEALMSRWRLLLRRYAGATPVRVFYQLSSDPLMTINGEHLIARSMAACGGVNAFADLPSLVPTINWEAAARSNPQLIATAGAPGETEPLGRWPQLRQVDAVSRRQFASLPPDLLSRMGPRFIEGAEKLCAAIDNTRNALRR